MTPNTEAQPEASVAPSQFGRSLSTGEDAALRDALKRCSGATLEAAREFRKTSDAECVPIIVSGIIERFVEPGLHARLADAPDNLRLIEDLGLDSLAMIEIVILAEDVFKISIDNDALRPLRTVRDLRLFVADRAARKR